MISVGEITISELKSNEVDEASWLLANTMATNPNLVAIFKSTDGPVVARQQRMFGMVLRKTHNVSFVAKIDGRIVGVMTYTTSEHCQLSVWEMLRSIPKFIGMFGKYLIPVLRWQAKWGKHDLKEKHVHFGPIAVDKNYQGLGVGGALLTNFCEYLDRTQQVGYLETDKHENVGLYRKYGFEVVETDDVLNVKNWFMVRSSNVPAR